MRAEIGSMGLIRGLLDLTVLGGVGLRVLGVVANEGGVCARMLNPKPAPCGVNAGFKCATDVDGGAWDTDELLEADDAVEGVSEADDAVADDAGGADGIPEADGAGGTQLQHWHFNFAINHRFSRIKITMMVVTTAHANIPIRI